MGDKKVTLQIESPCRSMWRPPNYRFQHHFIHGWAKF